MTGVSTLGQALNQIEMIKSQNKLFTQLSTQMSSGKKTTVFAGLESGVLASKRARAEFKSIETYSNNMTLANTRIELMLTAINEFKAQAENLSGTIRSLSQESAHSQGDIIHWDDPTTDPEVENVQVGVNSARMDVDFTTLQDLASNLYDFMKDLLNTKDSDRYLLNGADTLTKPLNDTGALDAAMTSLITNWKDELSPTNISTSQFISAMTSRTATTTVPNAITDTIVGYTADLASGNVGSIYVRVSETAEIDYTTLANDQSFRDIMVGLSFMKNATLSPIADVFNEPYTLGDVPIANGAPGATVEEMRNNFFEAFTAVSTMVENAIDNVDRMVANLESTRARLAELKASYAEQKNALKNTISGVEDVDTNEVAVKISTLQIQLDASYRITALLQEMSLAKYLAV